MTSTTTKTQPKRVLVTGATGSVGAALCEVFAESGYSVVLQFNQNKPGSRALSTRHRATPIQIDFGETGTLPERDFDVVVNNLGVNITNELTEGVDDEDWDRTLLLNLTTPFRVIKQCLPWMKKKKWGRIINISSIYGLRAVEGNLPYTVSKHGMSGLTRTVAKEYAKFGITSNEICPGPIESVMINRIAREQAAEEGGTAKEYLDGLVADIPAGRLATPQDVAALALYLASDQAAYVNGVSIPIDGALIV